MKLCILLTAVVLWTSCERPTQPPFPNTEPDTRLANVPYDSSTVFPLVKLSWSGGDYDGYVARYQYRYVTYHLAAGSTTRWLPYDSTAWKDTTGTSVTIAFNSNQALNMQRFMVRAVDNAGAVDPTPVERIIFTTKASPPISRIIEPVASDTILALEQVSDWWTGIRLTFTATDQTVGGSIVAYAWSVDGGDWNWGSDTAITIPPQYFRSPVTGAHTIKVTARNTTNLIDPIGDSVVVLLQRPTFERNVLIIDETDENNVPFKASLISDSDVDAFYARVFPGADQWDYKAHNGMPTRTMMAKYKLVVWHADDQPTSVPHKISDPKNIAIFTDYLKVGGKFLMSGWGILKSFAYAKNFPFSFQAGSFVYDYLHIQTVDQTPLFESDGKADCTGGDAMLNQFTSFKVDSAKLAFFPFYGKLGQVNVINSTAGFTVGLYQYANAPNSLNPKLRGRTIALRYYGTMFDAVVLGFPLYFIREEDATTMAQQILHNLSVE